MSNIHHSQAADFYVYVEKLEKENRKLKNEVNHLRAQIQRLNPPKKKPSYYEIKYNPVTKKYVQAHTIIKLEDEEEGGKYPYHDHKPTAYLFDALISKDLGKLTKLFDGSHGTELLEADPANFDRNLFHCLGMTFQITTEEHIKKCVEFAHSRLSHLDDHTYLEVWTKMLFAIDAQGYSPLHFLLYFTSRSLFGTNFVVLMKELQKHHVIRTETFLMGCGVYLRLTPERSFYYRNKYLEEWEIKEIPHYQFIISYQDLLEWIEEGDQLKEYPEDDIYTQDYAFVSSILTDFATEPAKNPYLIACTNGDQENIKKYANTLSPGVALEGIYLVCKHGYLDVLREWVREAPEGDLVPAFFERGFHGAVNNGDFPVVKYLISEIGMVPTDDDVIAAVQQGHLEMLVYFADRSDVSRSSYCVEPLKYIAANPEHNDFARRIVSLDWFRVDGRFQDGDIFSTAFQHENYNLVDIILDSRDASEFTPLASYAIMLFAKRANLSRIEAIVGHEKFSRKAYIWDSVITEDHETALFFAARHGDVELVRFLVRELGSKFELPDQHLNAKNILHFASEGGSMPVIQYVKNVLQPQEFNELLCSRGVDYTDHVSKYPFEFAKGNNHINVADYLLRLMDAIQQSEIERDLSPTKCLIPPDFVSGEHVVVDSPFSPSRFRHEPQ